MPPTKLEWVKKRDGRLVPFQKDKISQAIYKALKSTGQDDQLLAQEMSEAVAHYLEKNCQGKIPDIETIQDAVERVLVEMKLFETVKAYILYRAKRARLREAVTQGRTGGKPSELLVEPGEFRWEREKVIRALASKLQLPRLLAEHIADVVEENSLQAPKDETPPEQMDLIH